MWEGGGEYNVARSLRRCFGLRSAIVTALVDNSIGRLVEDLILQGGVDSSLICWRAFDGVGRDARNGLNFVERGFGVRPPVGCSDRGNTAISQARPGDFDWQTICASGVRCLHTGGVFAALSPAAPAVIEEAITFAKTAGTLISFDLNYRPSLWTSFGGDERARAVYSVLVSQADVLFAGIDDFQYRLGVDLRDLTTGPPDDGIHEAILHRVAQAYPNLKAIAMTLRIADSSCTHRWGAVALVQNQYVSIQSKAMDVLDRIGGGDSFAAGFLYGLLDGRDAATALAYGVAHGALAVTTPGDTSMATLAEVERLMAGGTVRTHR